MDTRGSGGRRHEAGRGWEGETDSWWARWEEGADGKEPRIANSDEVGKEQPNGGYPADWPHLTGRKRRWVPAFSGRRVGHVVPHFAEMSGRPGAVRVGQ